jgi:hypothetical protein
MALRLLSVIRLPQRLPQGAQLADERSQAMPSRSSSVLPEAFHGGLDALVSDEIHEQVIKALDLLSSLSRSMCWRSTARPSQRSATVIFFCLSRRLTRKSEAARHVAPGLAPAPWQARRFT